MKQYFVIFLAAWFGCMLMHPTTANAGRLPVKKKRATDYVLFVGTYAPKGTAISIYGMNAATGKLTYRGSSSLIKNPSYIAVHPNNKWVFAASEIEAGTIEAFRSDGGSSLERINAVSSNGADPCYVSVAGGYVLAANYSSGSVTSIPINPDGSLGKAVSTIANTATSINPTRQSAPHAHSVVPSFIDGLIYSADLGGDIIYGYRIDGVSGALSAVSKTHAAPGAGPRHLAFHPNKRWCYAVNELSVSVEAFTIDARNGRLDSVHTCPMLEANTGGATAADIHIGPSGRFLYASVRDPENIIVIFSIDRRTGMLTKTGVVSTGGRGPRNFVIDPSGRFLLVGNQKTDTITSFSIDPTSGCLTPIGDPIATPSPVCLKFAP